MDEKRYRNILFLIFTVSGFSGLIYESIWTHYLKLFLGHAAYAQTLVLAIFMGGMAAGSFISSKYIHKWGKPLKGYAAAELVIGCMALVFHPLFTKFMELSYARIIPALGTPLTVNMYKWLLSSLAILPQSLLLGMTFPLISTGILRIFREQKGGTIAMLYFTNSIGGAVGVLVSGFFYIPTVGLPWTIAIAGIINIAIAAAVFIISRDLDIDLAVKHKGLEAPMKPIDPMYRLFLFSSFITGAASFVYEIGWIRMLSLVLGSSTHAFELMLSAFITGLALGGLWIHYRIDRISNPVRFLMSVQLIMGGLALASLPLYANTFKIMQYVLKTVARTDTGYLIFNFSSHAIAMLIMLPAAICAGMTLPLITFILVKDGYGERSIGAVYGANTLGGILAVFASVHLLMPLLGLKGLITSGAALDIGLGILLLWSVCKYSSYLKPAMLTSIAVAVIMVTIIFVRLDPYKMASGIFRGGPLINPDEDSILYHQDGKTCTVSVTRDLRDGLVSIRTNGKTDGSIQMTPGQEGSSDESTMILAGAIPLLIKPDAKMAANIGMGTGLTTNTLLSAGVLEEVDTIEIEQKVIEGARFFLPRTSFVYNDPRSKLHIEDAKTFFSIHNKKYDIIISEPSNPWVSGVSGLFSDEFYKLIRHYLTDRGIFAQWCHLYSMDINLIASIVKALSPNFGDYAVYALNSYDVLIVATKAESLPGLKLDGFLSSDFEKQLSSVDVKNNYDLAIRKIWNKKMLDKVLSGIPIAPNSDYYPVLDTKAVRARFLHSDANEFISLLNEPLPVMEMMGISDMSWMDHDITPTDVLYKSQRLRVARAERDYYLHGRFDEKYAPITPEIRDHALQMERLFKTCGSGMTVQERMGTLAFYSSGVLPFLSADDSEAIWKKLGVERCLSSFTPHEKNWLSLFRAVGRRDAHAMAKEAETLIYERKKLGGEGGRYLLAAGLLGRIAGGEPEAAKDLWSKYGEKIELPPKHKSITLDLLKSQID